MYSHCIIGNTRYGPTTNPASQYEHAYSHRFLTAFTVFRAHFSGVLDSDTCTSKRNSCRESNQFHFSIGAIPFTFRIHGFDTKRNTFSGIGLIDKETGRFLQSLRAKSSLKYLISNIKWTDTVRNTKAFMLRGRTRK